MSEVKEVGGRKVGVIRAELTELIDLDPETLHERFSRRLVGHDRLVDLAYRVAGCVGDTIHLEVSGIEESATDGAPEEVLAQIAADVLDIETLETRGSDRLDFHDLSVMVIKEALAAAYEAGRLASGGA